jgi:hypothetical protein
VEFGPENKEGKYIQDEEVVHAKTLRPSETWKDFNKVYLGNKEKQYMMSWR